MRVDAFDRGAAMAGRIAQKIDHRLLRLVTHPRPQAFVRVNMYQFERRVVDKPSMQPDKPEVY
jgi:hypothetical protein